jgi:hypothetical protein
MGEHLQPCSCCPDCCHLAAQTNRLCPPCAGTTPRGLAWLRTATRGCLSSAPYRAHEQYVPKPHITPRPAPPPQDDSITIPQPDPELLALLFSPTPDPPVDPHRTARPPDADA